MATGKLPKALENKPDIGIVSAQYIEAFAILNNFRDMNGNLYFADIVKYAELIGEQNVLEFVSIIMKADQAFLEVRREDKTISLPQ